MTEYWVSQAKYYCKFCRIWMADNKVSRQNHDSSERHKNQVEFYHKKKRDEKLHGARSERDLQQQLASIERAAKEAVAQDRTQYQGTFYQGSNFANYAPPPPPPISQTGSMEDTPAGLTNDSKFNSLPSSTVRELPTFGNLSEKAMDMISENLRGDDQSSGVYTVRGVTYLEGQFHEDRLVGGEKCELFVEDEDDWCEAEIIRCRTMAVPHTALEQRTFDVSYQVKRVRGTDKAPLGDEPDSLLYVIEKEEEGVKSDRIRIVQKPAAAVAPTVVESTGFGQWQTVTVRTVDEDEELRQLRQREKEERHEQMKKKKALEKAHEQELLEAGNGDDALGSYDPYNTGIYKGIAVGPSKDSADGSSIPRTIEIEPLTEDGKAVGFKKRKAKGNRDEVAAKKRVPIRRKTTDEDDD